MAGNKNFQNRHFKRQGDKAIQERSMTKNAKYDDEVLEILPAWETGTLKPVGAMAEEIQAHQFVAAATSKKDQWLNIRIASWDLRSLQARALEERVPYQTFAASLLYKFVSGHLANQRS